MRHGTARYQHFVWIRRLCAPVIGAPADIVRLPNISAAMTTATLGSSATKLTPRPPAGTPCWSAPSVIILRSCRRRWSYRPPAISRKVTVVGGGAECFNPDRPLADRPSDAMQAALRYRACNRPPVPRKAAIVRTGRHCSITDEKKLALRRRPGCQAPRRTGRGTTRAGLP